MFPPFFFLFVVRKKADLAGGFFFRYIFLALETITVMGISVRWRSLSFKQTHLPERLGLLTLIILGEGVIVLTKSVNYIAGEDGWTWTSFGQVFVVVLTIVSQPRIPQNSI